MQSTFHYLRSGKGISDIKNQVKYVIQEHECQSRTIFSFSIYTISLQVTLVIYFGSELETLEGRQLPEDGKVYYY